MNEDIGIKVLNSNNRPAINSFITKGAIVCCITVAANGIVRSNNTQNVNYLGSAIYETCVYNDSNKEIMYTDRIVEKEVPNNKFENKIINNKATFENITVLLKYNNTIKENEISKEDENMRLKKVKALKNAHTEIISISTVVILLSIMGIVLFITNGIYIIHPVIYIFGVLMGLGWLSTGLVSIKTGRSKYGYK